MNVHHVPCSQSVETSRPTGMRKGYTSLHIGHMSDGSVRTEDGWGVRVTYTHPDSGHLYPSGRMTDGGYGLSHGPPIHIRTMIISVHYNG